jgi:hypothetical protein
MGIVDGYFDDDLDFVLSFTPEDDPNMDGGSGVGWINRDPWYDSSRSPFYADMEQFFDSVVSEYGSRFKGMRWNHEHRPRDFREGTKWVAYAEDNAEDDYREVKDNRTSEWRTYLANIAGTNSRDAYFNVGKAKEAPYNTSAYVEVKRLYKHFVDFQCKAQARMIDLVAGKLPGTRKLIFYPVADGPTLNYARSEYTVDFAKVTHGDVIGEIGTWDLISHTNSDRNGWAKGQGTRPYFMVLQQGNDNTEDISDEDHILARTDRVSGIIGNCLDPSGAEDPWADSFAFWNRWRSSRPGSPPITKGQQRDYMTQVKNRLT